MFRKNVAGQFIHFQGVDASTGGIKSGVTWTARRCIDGTFAAAGLTVTEDGTTGWYKAALTQADTNGNNIAFNFTGTGAVPQTVNIVTTACDPTSTAFGLSIAKTTNITGFNDIAATAIVSSGAITTSSGAVSTVTTTTTATNLTNLPSIPANWITTAGITDGAFTAAKFAASSLNGKGDWNIGKTGYALTATTGLGNQTANITGSLSGSVGSVTAGVTVTTNNDKTGYGLSAAAVQAVWDALTTALTTVGSIGKKLADWTIGTAQTGDAYARLGAPSGASVSADIAAVKSDTAAILIDTAEIGAAGAGLTALATAANLATVDSVVDAVKAKTDSLTFTIAGQVDANIQSINDVAITGDGSGTPFNV